MCPVALTDTVTLTYTATLENGELIDKSPEGKPVTISIGRGTLFMAVEASLFGMESGETRQVNIQPEDAYGHRLKELVQEVPRNKLKGDVKPGMILSLTVQKEGEQHQVPATVVSVTDDTVTVDYNHPLAGEIIVYTVTLVGINT